MNSTSTQGETIVYEFDISDEEDGYFDITPAFAPPANSTINPESTQGETDGPDAESKKTLIEPIIQTRRTAGSKRVKKHQTLVDARNGVETMHSITAVAGYRHSSFEVRRLSPYRHPAWSNNRNPRRAHTGHGTEKERSLPTVVSCRNSV